MLLYYVKLFPFTSLTDIVMTHRPTDRRMDRAFLVVLWLYVIWCDFSVWSFTEALYIIDTWGRHKICSFIMLSNFVVSFSFSLPFLPLFSTRFPKSDLKNPKRKMNKPLIRRLSVWEEISKQGHKIFEMELMDHRQFLPFGKKLLTEHGHVIHFWNLR